MKTVISAGLLALLCLPVIAAPKEKRTSGDATVTTPAATVADALNQVAGKNQIVGITETGGTRFLGRVTSGDHGLFLVQTFHFAGRPHETTQTTTQTTGSGKKKRTTHGTTPIYTDTTIPDDQAVRLLLSGAAGATVSPREVAGTREMLSATDVRYIQTLSPPNASTAAKQSGWTMTSLWPPAKPDAAKP